MDDAGDDADDVGDENLEDEADDSDNSDNNTESGLTLINFSIKESQRSFNTDML